MLNKLITSKTRLSLLIKFFINAANEGYLRGLATEMNENSNAIRKELNNLSSAGYISRTEQDGKITYKANKNHPLFSLLQQMVRKYVGLDSIVEHILSQIGHLHRVYLMGDYAKGIDSGVIAIMLEGPNINKDYLDQLALKIEKEIQKKVVFQTTSNFQGEGLLVFEAN
jgi:predicted transcriptional regulator